MYFINYLMNCGEKNDSNCNQSLKSNNSRVQLKLVDILV